MSAVDENQFPVDGHTLVPPSFERLRLNHYHCKSEEEFVAKFERWRAIGRRRRIPTGGGPRATQKDGRGERRERRDDPEVRAGTTRSAGRGEGRWARQATTASTSSGSSRARCARGQEQRGSRGPAGRGAPPAAIGGRRRLRHGHVAEGVRGAGSQRLLRRRRGVRGRDPGDPRGSLRRRRPAVGRAASTGASTWPCRSRWRSTCRRTSAAGFVAEPHRLAPVVMFSAAIPHQGGIGHVNEQWPEYWRERFGQRGFLAVDCVRPRIWEHPDVRVWYAQNTLLFVEQAHSRRYPELKREYECTREPPALDRPPDAVPARAEAVEPSRSACSRARTGEPSPRRSIRPRRRRSSHACDGFRLRAHAAARASRTSRSRALRVSDAARSNSARASSKRPSLASRSPRTLGSRW